MKKRIAIIASALLALCLVVTGTIAYLTRTSETVNNTFTVGNIEIELKEHKLADDGIAMVNQEVTANANYKLIPGRVASKDPFVRVKAGSEKCWIYVGVNEENNEVRDPAVKVILWEPATGWSKVGTRVVDGVTYTVYGYQTAIEAGANAAADPVYFLKSGDSTINANGTVQVNPILDQADFVVAPAQEGGQETALEPKLHFIAFAIQYEGLETSAQAAWTAAFPE